MAKKGKKPEQGEAAPPPTAPAPARAPELQAAWEAFDRGDNRTARREARAVLARPEASEQLKQEAADLLGRVGFEPLALASVIIVALVITGILIALSLGHKFG